jgi:hypothetical protein
MASVAEDVNQILLTLQALEERMKGLRAMLAPKTRKANPWIVFSKRINALMKENNTPFTNMVEATQFVSSLKKQKGYEWSDEEIMNERTDWLTGTLKSCIVCEQNPTESLFDHRDCIVKFAIEEGKAKNPVGAWMQASSSLRTTVTKVKMIEEAVSEETTLPGSL